MQHPRTTLPGAALLFAASMGVTGCGGVVTMDSGAEETTTFEPGQPPNPPENAPIGEGPGVVLAVSKLDLGSLDEQGYLDMDRWRTYGYDLDHQDTPKTGPGTCAPVTESKEWSFEDGEDGIDNTFGRMVGNLLYLLDGQPPYDIESTLAEGAPTLLFDLQDLGTLPVYSSISAAIYESTTLLSPPKYDGTDVFPVSAESTQEGGETPDLKLVESYVADDGEHGTWVARGEGTRTMRITIGDPKNPALAFRMRIHEPIVAIKLTEDRRHGTGTLAGRVSAEEVLTEALRITQVAEPDTCGQMVLEQLKQGLARGADLRLDGNTDPTLPCDAFSLGLRFKADAVLLGPVAPPEPDLAPPCVNP